MFSCVPDGRGPRWDRGAAGRYLLRTKRSASRKPVADSPESRVVDAQAVQQAAELLVSARRPVIWAGGGVMRAKAATLVAELADYLQIPVVTTRQGKGAISELHPLSLGMAEMRFQPLRSLAHRSGPDPRSRREQLKARRRPACYPHRCRRVRTRRRKRAAGHSRRCLSGNDGAQPGCRRCRTFPRRQGGGRPGGGRVHKRSPVSTRPSQLQPQWGFMEAIHAALAR